jgi:hypothetical protein
MLLTVNSDCFPKQHYPAGLGSGDMFPERYELSFIYYVEEIHRLKVEAVWLDVLSIAVEDSGFKR